MGYSYGFLGLGLAMALVGAAMVYVSLRARPGEVRSRGVGVIFFGPIPIVISGGGRWVIIVMILSVLVVMMMAAGSMQTNLIGW